MDVSEEALLSLLRLALGNSTTELPADFRWEDVKELSERQGVFGVAFDGIQLLPKRLLPPMDILMDWLGQVNKMESDYINYERTICQFTNNLLLHGHKVLIMKGYGCSLNYPKPNHRPCGDIDIWTFGKHSVIDGIVNNHGIDVSCGNVHHSVFMFNRFAIENHYTILDVNVHPSSQYLNCLLEKLADNYRLVNKLGVDICLPSVNFNSIHLLRHMANDFATVKTSLRHILDWATFVARNEVDWNFVFGIAEKTNMCKFLNVINGICVYYLGYSKELFPIEKRNMYMEHRVLNDILAFRESVAVPNRGSLLIDNIRYALKKTKIMLMNRWKYKMVYDESLFSSFIWKCRNRLKQTRRIV